MRLHTSNKSELCDLNLRRAFGPTHVPWRRWLLVDAEAVNAREGVIGPGGKPDTRRSIVALGKHRAKAASDAAAGAPFAGIRSREAAERAARRVARDHARDEVAWVAGGGPRQKSYTTYVAQEWRWYAWTAIRRHIPRLTNGFSEAQRYVFEWFWDHREEQASVYEHVPNAAMFVAAAHKHEYTVTSENLIGVLDRMRESIPGRSQLRFFFSGGQTRTRRYAYEATDAPAARYGSVKFDRQLAEALRIPATRRAGAKSYFIVPLILVNSVNAIAPAWRCVIPKHLPFGSGGGPGRRRE